jgi:hypothetical protein
MSDRSAAVSLSRSEWRVGEVIEDLYEVREEITAGNMGVSSSSPPATNGPASSSPPTNPSEKRTCWRERVHSAAETSLVRDSP